MSKESDQWLTYAEDILQEMKDKKVVISQVTYHGMMNIHAKSSSRDGAKNAEEFLRGMEAEGLSPNDMSYNICIDAYARRGDHRNARSLLEEMLSLSDRGNVECRPSIHSFASVVRAPSLASSQVEIKIVLISFACYSVQLRSMLWRNLEMRMQWLARKR
jgi:pentatricopeptide repeat protein